MSAISIARLVSTVAVALLAACGGGGEEPEPTAAERPMTVCATKRVALFGDSTLGGSARDDLFLELQRRFGEGRVSVENRAVGGTSAVQLLEGRDGLNKPWAQQLAETRPHVVYVNHAINSMAMGYSVADFRFQLDQLVTQAQDVGVRVVLATPVPQTLSAPYGTQWRVDTIKVFADAVRSVAAERGAELAEVSRFVEAVPGYEALVSDGIHPSGPLIPLIYAGPAADAIAQAVSPLTCN